LNRESQSDFKNRVLDGVLGPNGTYRGLTYSNYLTEWLRFYHGDYAFFRGDPGEILYLEGNNHYVTDSNTGIRRQSSEFLNNARNVDGTNRGQMILNDTAIFVPIMNSFYSVTESYEGNVLQTLADCQYICRRDTNETQSLYCTLTSEDGETVDLFDEIYYFESSCPNLMVAENNTFRNRIEMTINPGVYDSFIASYAIMLNTSGTSHLQPGNYRLRFGGIGRGYYKTNTVQDFTVRPNPSLYPMSARGIARQTARGIARQTARLISKQEPPVFDNLELFTGNNLISKQEPPVFDDLELSTGNNLQKRNSKRTSNRKKNP
jgi:hypothetical protein